MKTKSIFAIAALVAITSFTACGNKKGGPNTAGSEEYELVFNLPKGKVYNMQMNMSTEIEVSLMGQTMNSTNTSDMTMDYEIKDVLPNGNFVIRTTVKKIKISESGMGSNASYDSETDKATGENAQEFAAQQKAKLNSWTEIEMDKYGKTIKTTYSDSTNTKGGGVMDGFNFSMFPNKKVKVGETWTSNTDQKMKDVELIIKSTYSLLSVKDGVAETNLDGTIAIQPGEIKTTLNGTQKGTIQIELATGITREANIVQDMDMEISDNEMKMPMKMKNTIKITMK
jgi:hypothetical protein